MALNLQVRVACARTETVDPLRSSVVSWSRQHAAPLWGALFIVISGMAVSLLWPIVGHGGGWLTPADLWGTFRDAHLVGWGGEADIYQARTGYLSPPAFPVLLAPVAMLSGALHLSESFPFYLHHPTAWLLLGPVELACGAWVLFPIDALARRLGVPRGRRLGAMWASAVLAVPLLVIWGHPEDLLALGCTLYALLAAFDARWTRSAALLGVGLAFQPLVVLCAPLLIARMPWRTWARAAGIAVLPSALLLIAPLLHAWRTTLHAIVDQPTYPRIGRATPWVALAPIIQRAHALDTHAAARTAAAGRLLGATTEVTAGGPGRLIAIGIALAIGLVVALRGTSDKTLVALAALCLALRCVFESVMFPYYVVPALLVGVVAAAGVSRRRLVSSTVAAGACASVAYLHAGPWTYYLAVTALLLGAAALGAPGRKGAPEGRTRVLEEGTTGATGCAQAKDLLAEPSV
ncbi:MAG: hypothetical protein M0Z46_16070 [Actinomycetota bacterium]|nr:hypothetical protein [Actinomycetota bacterium]